MTDFLRDLNDVQRSAVTATEGPVMVLAGAGSGKTRVITYRIAHLIRNNGVSPYNILALTFTNKAAGEMRHRIDTLLQGSGSPGLWIGTFHSVFARLLRSHIHLLGYDRNFSIFDSDDSKSLIRQSMNDLGISHDSLPVNAVQSIISKAKNSFILPSEFQSRPGDYNQQKAAKVYELYTRKLRENNALDFDDLLIKPLELFREHESVLAELQETFRYILIDEYQDTNRAQYLAAKMLGARHRNIFVVGDDAQSIYSWRGADISNILNFQDDYQESMTFKLVENYRSTGTILQAANSVIRNNRRQIKKELVSHRSAGEPVTLLEAYNERQEAEKVVEQVRSMRKKDGHEFSAFAVFYRTNAQSRVLEDVMRQNRIPYRIFGSVSFYKRKEIKDAVAYLRFIVNERDNESLLRIINFPPRKIGEVSIAKLKEYAVLQDVSLYDAIRSASGGGFQQRLLNALESFSSVVEQLKQLAEYGSVYDVLSELFNLTGIPAQLQAENTAESLARYDNLQELLSMARDFSDHNPDSSSLGDFLENISLASDYDETRESDNYVSLMTVHASKGLEFPVVFITGMEERLFPLNTYEHDELEEERRLFYVAMTRAKEKIFLSWARSRYQYGQPQQCLRSMFVGEIDASIVRTESGELLSMRGTGERSSSSGIAPSRGFQRRELSPQATGQESKPAAKGLRAGTLVHHALFGPGMVLELHGSGSAAKVKIRFRSAGDKTLMVQYANLKIVG
ncbi:MAG: UvrD-helicase domain-containing protein [Chlorobium sp.]|uniref:ATP-dependent helicase n=1 Tax=Chlorobium sp. TaxID=1095 RepID=UPI0025BAF89E|nr:UvrD-helicase domain-containing protein [Chlorobium sp.]MCF8383645.1 UvrD-helicase domain-containing protein [Chlorobium sp.]